MSSMPVDVSGAHYSLWSTNKFVFWKFRQGIYNFEETKKSIVDVIGGRFCPTFPNQKFVYLSINRNSSFYDCKKCKICSHVHNIFLRTKNQQLYCLVVMVHVFCKERRVATMKTEINLKFWKIFCANHNQAHSSPYQKKQKSFRSWHNLVDTSLVQTVHQKITSVLILYTVSVQ